MENKQPFMLLPTVESRIIAGIISFTGIMILLAWVVINENARMEEFKERFDGRSIESGAILYENNCASCHGYEGLGLSNVAPALNNPHFFGFDYFGEIDSEVNLLNAQLEAEGELEGEGNLTAEEEAAIEAEIEALQDDRIALEDALLYGYEAEYEAAISALETFETQLVADFADYTFNYPNLSIQSITSGRFLEAAASELASQQALLEEELELADDETTRAEIQAGLDAIALDLEVLSPEVTTLQGLDATANRFQRMINASAEVVALRAERDRVEGELAALPQPPEEGEDPDAAQREEFQTLLDEIDIRLEDADERRQEARNELVEVGEIQAPFDVERNASGRLDELAWNGTLEDLVFTTLIAGRPTSSSYWPSQQGMAAWSQDAGGPLRRDEVQNLTDYILNWDKGNAWTIEDQRAVAQYAIIPASGGGSESSFDVVNAIVPDALDNIVAVVDELEALQADDAELPEEAVVWDANAGQIAYQSNGCLGCHILDGGGTGPSPVGIVGRAEGYAAESDNIENARFYLVQSIMNPGAFIVEGFSNAMPAGYAGSLSLDELSNIVAYLETLQ